MNREMRKQTFSNLIDLLRFRAAQQPNQTAYTFLEDGEDQSIDLTYRELDQKAREIAARLQAATVAGDRVLLLYHAGLDYISAFFGCLYAEVIAVPAYPPRNNHSLLRLQSIVNNSQATVTLSTTSVIANINRKNMQDRQLQQLTWLATDAPFNAFTQSWREPDVQGDTLAFLQYTSGSTGAPKGAMITHSNLLHNQALIQHAMGHDQHTIFVGWLPLFHDMGLIGNMLQPLYLGIPCTFMAPVSFLQKPLRWLQAISKYSATTSGAPNFAYDLCVRKVTDEQRASLDLSSWKVAFTGAEPVRAQTLARFAAAFESCGFRQEALYPCYGMAETTLIVSGGSQNKLPILKSVRASELRQDRVHSAFEDDSKKGSDAENDVSSLVGCGKPILDLQVVIADPKTLVQCQPDQVGEIWVKGDSVAQGYWQQAEATHQSFQAFLKDTNQGPFLRTGDLGFLENNELFITGRLKDLVIIRGRNYYPQDIEFTVFQSHPALRVECGAAFSVEEDDVEKLVIVQEVKRSHIRKINKDEVIKAIRLAVAKYHDLNVHAVVLLKTGRLSKTSSGKVQRRTCRTQFLENELVTVGQWQAASLSNLVNSSRYDTLRLDPEQISESAIGDWLVACLAQRLDLDVNKIERHQPFTYYGLSSLDAVDLTGELEVWLKRSLCPTLTWEYPSIQDLSQYLSEQPDEQKHVPESFQPQDNEKYSQILNSIENLSADDAREALEQSRL